MTPIDKSEAERRALDYVKEQEAASGIELVLLREETASMSYGWVFFYDSKKHQETGDILDSLAGNAPIVITKNDGLIHETGTALPLEDYLSRFGHRGWRK